jgi:hypothetical protein
MQRWTGAIRNRPPQFWAFVAGAEQVLRASRVADRCQIVGGDFFEMVSDGGDVYVLKFILR